MSYTIELEAKRGAGGHPLAVSTYGDTMDGVFQPMVQITLSDHRTSAYAGLLLSEVETLRAALKTAYLYPFAISDSVSAERSRGRKTVLVTGCWSAFQKNPLVSLQIGDIDITLTRKEVRRLRKLLKYALKHHTFADHPAAS